MTQDGNQSKHTKKLKAQNKGTSSQIQEQDSGSVTLFATNKRCWWKINTWANYQKGPPPNHSNAAKGIWRFMSGKCICLPAAQSLSSSWVSFQNRVENTDCQVIYFLALNFGIHSYVQGQPHQTKTCDVETHSVFIYPSLHYSLLKWEEMVMSVSAPCQPNNIYPHHTQMLDLRPCRWAVD